ncbi:MAG TPA: hypothetical protein VFR79_11710 [Nitrospira sp.]|nr:hypothetical protein [Nitrospira sp.]
MKPIAVAGICCLCLFVNTGLEAQEPAVKVVRIRPNLDTDKLQYILSTERKQVFERNMNLNEQQSEVFWGVYHRYEKEKEQLEANRLRLLGTYIEKYATLTNDDILKIVKQSGENQRADLALRQKYFHIYSKKLDPIAAARFLQLDDIVGMVTRLAILGNLPLIGDVPHSAASGEIAPASSERETPPSTGDQPLTEPQK